MYLFSDITPAGDGILVDLNSSIDDISLFLWNNSLFLVLLAINLNRWVEATSCMTLDYIPLR